VRRLVALVGAVVFLDTMFFAALAPLLPEYADALALSKAEAGVLAGAYPAGVLLAGIPSGVLASRIGVKRTLLGGLLLLAATTVAFGFADEFSVLVAARFVQGTASACAWTAGFTWLVGAAPPARRGEVIGTALGVAIAGALFGPVLGAVASIAGTEPAFGGVGGLAVGLAAWAAATPAPTMGARQPVSTLAAALRAPAMAAGLWFIVLPALLFGTLGVLAPLELDRLGFGSPAIGAVFLVAAAGEAMLAPLLGRISDRRGRAVPLRIGLVASAVIATALPWPDERFVLAALVVAAGLAFGTFWAPAMAWLTDTAEGYGLDHAYAFALINLAWAPGQAAGAAAGGAVAGATSDAVPYLALAAVCVGTLALFARRRGAVARASAVTR
jgi:predicted MFS family arabinose efflux permease